MDVRSPGRSLRYVKEVAPSVLGLIELAPPPAPGVAVGEESARKKSAR
jgi:hypothetical protein